MNKTQLIVAGMMKPLLPILILLLLPISLYAEAEDLVNAIAEAEIENMRAGLQAWTDQKEIEKLSGITLDDKYVKKLYQEFKSALVNPPNPDTYTTYSIENGEEALKKVEQLGRKLHNLLMALSDENFDKYGKLIAGMRELLYIDAQHILLAIRGDNSRDVYWYMRHNSAVEKIEQEYLRLFDE